MEGDGRLRASITQICALPRCALMQVFGGWRDTYREEHDEIDNPERCLVSLKTKENRRCSIQVPSHVLVRGLFRKAFLGAILERGAPLFAHPSQS